MAKTWRELKNWFGAACAVLLVAGAGCQSDSTPTVFDIGSNDPNAVVAFGDSISEGYGSVGGNGYRDDLERLFAADGRSHIRVIDEGDPGTFSYAGVQRIDSVLAHDRPAVLILLYGTNDEFASLPRLMRSVPPETTSGNLRQIIAAARANQTLVVLSTLTPVCGRRVWQRNNIVEMNKLIREMAVELQATDNGVFFADAWDAFLNYGQPDGCSLINMESGNHPNEAGYALLAEIYYNALGDARW